MSIKINVPYYKQHTIFDCGPASLRMVFAFLENHKDYSTLKEQVKVDAELGTSHGAMIEAARKEGYFCYVNTNSTIHEIKHFISMHMPVIVNFIEPSDNDGHYAVVKGYEGTTLILNDPWNGEDFSISETDFINRWHDTHAKHRRWLMVISKEDLQLGKQYLPL